MLVIERLSESGLLSVSTPAAFPFLTITTLQLVSRTNVSTPPSLLLEGYYEKFWSEGVWFQRYAITYSSTSQINNITVREIQVVTLLELRVGCVHCRRKSEVE